MIEGDPGQDLLKVGNTQKRGVIEAEIRNLNIRIEGGRGQGLLLASITEEAGCPPEIQMKINQNTEGTPGQSLPKASIVPLIKWMKNQNVVTKSIYCLPKVGLLEEADLLRKVLKTMIQDPEGVLGQSQQKVSIKEEAGLLQVQMKTNQNTEGSPGQFL